MIYISAVLFVLILVGGGCLSILEPQTVKGGFGDALWCAFVTASTVGYGDISPSTLWGRIIAVRLMLVGIGVMSTVRAMFASGHPGRENEQHFGTRDEPVTANSVT